MDGILALAARHGFDVIEDCAQAHGATINGRVVGSFGRASAFSFCQDKIVTTGGEGGAVVTNDERVRDAVWAGRDHGKSFRAFDGHDGAPGFRWVHESIGTNARLTEFQAAIGLMQVDRLPSWLEIRRRNAAILDDALADVPGLRIVIPSEGIDHAYYRYYAFVRTKALASGWDRSRIIASVSAEGVPVSTGSYSEIYREKVFADMRVQQDRLPVARRLGETSLAFLVHPTLGVRELADTADAVKKVMAHASS
jgi:hypothetical protein